MFNSRNRRTLWLGLAILGLMLAFGPAAGAALAGVPSRLDNAALSGAAQASGITVSGPAGKVVANAPARPEVVLYDQYDNAVANATTAQNFEPANDAFDAELADDFIVPAGGWSVEMVEIDGAYFNGIGPAASVNINFYADAGGLPGALVASRPSEAYTPGPGAGDLVINLSSAVALPPGHHWMSVQVNMDFAGGQGQWGWNDRSVTSTNPAAWRNPGGGFATACTNWGARGASCAIDPTNPDQVFRLSGTGTGAPTNTPTATATPCGAGAGWIPGPPFPTNVVRAVGVWFPANGKFYSMGGRSADAAGNDLQNPREFTHTGGGSGTWAVKVASFGTTQTSNMACAALNSPGGARIYCVGGSAGGGTTASDQVFEYNPVADTMTLVATDPWPGAGELLDTLPGGFAVHGNKLYILGGFQINVGMVNSIWAFDPMAAAGSRWVQKSATIPYPTGGGLGYIPAATVGGFIYTAGGTEWIAPTIDDTQATYRYDPVADVIDDGAVPELPAPGSGETRALNVGGQVWLIGGGRTAPNPTNAVLIFDPANPGAGWQTGPAFTGPRRNFPVDIDPATSTIYMAGGYQPTTPTNSMQVYLQSAPCVPTATVTSSPTRTNTRTATPTPTCPPVMRSIGKGAPGQPVVINGSADSADMLASSSKIGKTVPQKPFRSDNAPIAFELDDGTDENSIGFGTATTQTAAIWLNRFTPPAGAYPITLNRIHILWPSQSTITLTNDLLNQNARLLVYSDADGNNDPANATLVSSVTVPIDIVDAFQTYNVNITVPGPTGDVYIGFEDMWAEGGRVPRLFPAAIDQSPPSQVRSWVAGDDDGTPDFTPLSANDTLGIIDTFGFPGNWLIRANGTSSLPDPCPATRTPTATASPTPANVLIGHLTVQSVAQPNVRNTLVTPTLTLCVGGVPQSQVLTLDQSAFFTITTGLPNGSYNYSIKWVRGLANAGSLSLSGGTSTHEFGTLRGGDSNNSNIVNSIDFNQLRTAFGTANNLATDFNLDNITNSLDFNILRGNFGVAGGILACP